MDNIENHREYIKKLAEVAKQRLDELVEAMKEGPFEREKHWLDSIGIIIRGFSDAIDIGIDYYKKVADESIKSEEQKTEEETGDEAASL